MTLSAESRIILVRVKVERAKKHLGDLEVMLRAFRDDSLHVLIPDKDPRLSPYTVELVELPKQPFDALAAAGDIVHNLRTALDHLAWQLVLAAGNQPKRGVTGFPIAEDVCAYNRIKGTKVKGMRPDAIKRIDAFKPYKGGNDPLWRIHELDNIDKHRNLLTAHRDCLFVADWLELAWPYLLKASDPHFTGFFDEQVEQDVEFDIEKAVSDTKAVKSNALLPSLHQLVDFVSNLVVSFKADLA